MLRPALVVAALVALATTAAPVQPVEAASTRVSAAAPQYDSPGALVPAIVTAYHPPTGYSVTLTMSASNGATVQCVGRTWSNPVTRTVHRKCYVSLPTKRASVKLTGHALFTKPGKTRITRSGAAPRPVLADGPVTRRMTLARAKQVERCFNATSNVWLTFDDKASASQLRTILATLKRNNVRGRFFFIGDWMRSNPSVRKLIVIGGHRLANHTASHPALSKASGSEIEGQIRRGLRATTSPKLLRPPYGAGALTGRVDSVAVKEGYRLCRWTTDTYDWEGPSAATMANRVRYGDYRTAPVEAGGVVLMHGTGRYTASGLQRIIDTIRAKGLKLEPLRSTGTR
jgi:peptidoglycan/xylan/chitin deacetylase (PgdA/CDA1 family)